MRKRRGTTRLLVVSGLLSASLGVAGLTTITAASTAGASTPKIIKIGLTSTLTGPSSSSSVFGQVVEAYLQWVNSKGGINGYRFQWENLDNQNQTATSVSVAEQLVNGFHANMILGIGTVPIEGELTVAPQLKMDNSLVPVLMAGNGALFNPPNINPATSNMFDATPDFDSEYEADYVLARKLVGNKPVGVLQQADAVGAGAAAIPLFAAASGLPAPVYTATASVSTTNCTPYMANMQAAGVKAIAIAASSTLVACMANAAAAIGYYPKWAGGYSDSGSALYALMPGTYSNISLWGYNYSLLATSNVHIKQYLAVMNKYLPADVTNAYSFQGWDYGAIAAEAVKLATANGQKFNEAKFFKVFQKDFTGQQLGITGSVTWNKNEHAGVNSMAEFHDIGQGGTKQLGGFVALPKPYDDL